jgi:hypothetical protein
LNIEQKKFIEKNHLNQNKKVIREFGLTLDIVGKPFMSRI